MAGHEAVKPAGADDVQPRLGHPRALLVGGGDDAVRPHAEAVGIAEDRGHHRKFATIGQYLQQHAPMRRALGAADEIKIARRIRLQTRRIRMPAAANHNVIIKRLVKIGLAVAVLIVQPCNLIAPQHVHLILHNPQPQRLIQPRGKPMPLYRLQLGINPRHLPNIPVHRANIAIPIARKIVPRRKHQRIMRIFVRHRDGVDGKRRLALIDNALGDNRRAPPARA